MAFREIALQYRYSIALVLLFVFVENVSFIIEPTFFGKLLDALDFNLFNKRCRRYASQAF
jgi:hypothetical protein